MSGQHTPEPWASMNVTDGGPAFPLQHAVADANDPGFKFGQRGMTLRDYFAAKAMLLLADQDILAAIRKQAENNGEEPADGVAAFAYDVADAMLRAREAK